MEFYESKMEYPPYFLHLMLYFVAQAQTFLDFSKMSPILAKSGWILVVLGFQMVVKKPDLTRFQIFVSYKDARRISKLKLNEYIRRTARPWHSLGGIHEATFSRGHSSLTCGTIFKNWVPNERYWYYLPTDTLWVLKQTHSHPFDILSETLLDS